MTLSAILCNLCLFSNIIAFLFLQKKRVLQMYTPFLSNETRAICCTPCIKISAIISPSWDVKTIITPFWFCQKKLLNLSLPQIPINLMWDGLIQRCHKNVHSSTLSLLLQLSRVHFWPMYSLLHFGMEILLFCLIHELLKKSFSIIENCEKSLKISCLNEPSKVSKTKEISW